MPKIETSEKRLNELARKVAKLIGQDLPGDVGFGLFLFNYGNEETGEAGFMSWISNAERQTMIPALKEWIARAEGRFSTGPNGRH